MDELAAFADPCHHHDDEMEIMNKSQASFDVLVLGNHPASYFAALLLRQKDALRVGHCSLPDEKDIDRLCVVNPALFSLHPSLEPLKKKLAATGVWGVEFLSDDGTTRSEYRAKSSIATVLSCHALRDAVQKLAAKAGVVFFSPDSAPVISGVDEHGVDVVIAGKPLRASALAVAGTLPEAARRALGIEEAALTPFVRQYTFARLSGPQWVSSDAKPLMRMSLDLGGNLQWGWMLTGKDEVQLAVETPANRSDGPAQLSRWATVLHRHGHIKSAEIPAKSIQSLEVAFAGALEREGVANRTLLIGPAGGFFSATGEDLYPNCWSAVFAAETLTKALKEPHLQDALQTHRQDWGATLGDYLRGPQQNLRFLMTMVYRNPVMTARMSESILLGKPVVR